MDFESPDVAKEFPGLAIALSDDAPEYEEGDKVKRKKEKKESKKDKDKDKGYEALDGESSPDEEHVPLAGDSKSPGNKVKKMKSFSLTSSTKKKDKDKESKKSSDKKSSAVAPIEKVTSKEKEKKVKDKKSSVPLEPKEVTQQEKEVVRRPFDGSHRKSFPATVVPNRNSPSTSTAASSSLPKATPAKGLNVFLNAPLPSIMLLKKKDHKDKDKDKEHKESKKESSTASKVRLKLKRGSKASIDETSSSTSLQTASVEPPLTPSRQQHLPEDPEVIGKEIRKYEALLELTHSQFKSGKKMSKKHEEQLWELQRTLTQLKRKLRSVNALSASFATPSGPTSQAPSASSSSTNPYISSSESEKSVIMKPMPPVTPLAVPAQNIPKIPAPGPVLEEEKLDFTPRTVPVAVPEVAEEVPLKIEPIPVTTKDEQVSADEPTPKSITKVEVSPESTRCENIESPFDEMIDTKFQVEVDVHVPSSSRIGAQATPEEIYEKEIQSFDMIRSKMGPVDPEIKRQNVDIIHGGPPLSATDSTPVTSKSEPTLGGGEEGSKDIYNERQRHDVGEYGDDLSGSENEGSGDYVLLQGGEMLQDVKPTPAFRVIPAPPIFDPFALPIFKTDDFISVENEMLIAFNLQLQDDIVHEEEEIEKLARQIQELNVSKSKESAALSDLTELDDDELVNVWQIVKFENDTLNEQVHNLRCMVAISRLEEFRLETRLKYLQDYISSTSIQGERNTSEESQGRLIEP